MVRRSGSNLCCPMSSRWKSLSALSTASAASRSVIACATCCGARWGSLCASWPLFIVPADEYGPVARCHRHHSHLWPSFQDRTHVQAGCPSNRLIRLPFLDDGHDPVAIPEREPAPSSPVGSLPRTNPPQNPCLSCLHAGWCHRAGPATVSLGRVSKAGLGLVRLLAQNHSSRHSTIGICRWQCDAPDDSRFSRELRKNQFSCRIHHRPARYRQYEGIPPGFINEKV